MMARLRRVPFAAKSERMDAVQHGLFDEAMAEDIAAVEAAQVKGSAPAPKTPRARPQRRALPPELERVTTRHEPDHCDCAACRAALMKIGEHASGPLLRILRPQHSRIHVYQARRQAAGVLRTPRRLSTVRLPHLRNHRGRAGCAGDHRSRLGRPGPAGLGGHPEVRRSFAAAPAGSDLCAPRRHLEAHHVGQVDGPGGPGARSAVRRAAHLAANRARAARRRNTGGPA
jgi:hypothetical protein